MSQSWEPSPGDIVKISKVDLIGLVIEKSTLVSKSGNPLWEVYFSEPNWRKKVSVYYSIDDERKEGPIIRWCVTWLKPSDRTDFALECEAVRRGLR